MKFATFCIVVVLSFQSWSQRKEFLSSELQIESDNDAYTLNLTRDQYYSNGLYLRYRTLTDSTRWNASLEKVIRSFHINHRMFSPKRIWWEDSSEMDRPFAGQLSISLSHEYYFKKASYVNVKLELGWMGPSLRTGELQYRWHKAFGMTLPKGWRYQISDSPIVNLYGTYAKTLLTVKDLDITSESNLGVGTTFNYARQEIMIRFGDFLSLHKSTQYNALVGRKNEAPGVKEFYFFLSPGIEYVFHNATIEGNFIGEPSIYTEAAEPWVFQTRAGLMMSWTKFDLAFLYYRRTNETPEATFHKYMGIRMNQRF